MRVSEYIVDELIKQGVTDAFGIPGGVILPVLYELDKSDITPHLTYHEQAAAFAACGYAQASGKLGVAYATRGPGISNMFTAIAEAYQESIPVLFVTAHGRRERVEGVRFSANQEVDIVCSVQNITKFAVNIEETDQVVPSVRESIRNAVSGRKGPVLIDVFAGLWDKEISIPETNDKPEETKSDIEKIVSEIKEQLNVARRPVILIGDGLRYAADREMLLSIADNLKLPILSSRGSQDLASGSPYYYGYVGSHGIRYSNFILSKADMIIVVGNRMAFPYNSASFAPILEQAQILRIDIDEGELKNSIPGEVSYNLDAAYLLEQLLNENLDKKNEWLNVCDRLREELNDEDCAEPVNGIVEYIVKNGSCTYVCDVGNNEFWFSRAYEKARCKDLVLMSKSFGTLGSAIGKAIGAYYATHKDIVCVVGDQGFQYNIQELQYISYHQLPIKILLINNNCSRMIADHENGKYGDKLIHVTKETGYGTPDFMAIAKAYRFEDRLIVLDFDDSIKLTPTLPKGRACQDMEPSISRDRYNLLNSL